MFDMFVLRVFTRPAKWVVFHVCLLFYIKRFYCSGLGTLRVRLLLTSPFFPSVRWVVSHAVRFTIVLSLILYDCIFNMGLFSYMLESYTSSSGSVCPETSAIISSPFFPSICWVASCAARFMMVLRLIPHDSISNMG